MAGPGEVLLEVRAVGLCGSDLHWFSDGAIGETRLERPLVLGHEVTAIIADGPRRGRRVALDPAQPCGACPVCRSGREELCPATRFAGHGTTDGGLRRYLAWPETLLRDIPDAIGDPEACLLEALGVAIHAVDLAAIEPESRVAVVGCGPIGLLVVATLRAAGIAGIGAVEPLAHRRVAAESLGATTTATDVDLEADVVLECSGEAAAVEAAIRIARPAGRVVLVGIPGDDRTSFTASTARRKGLTIVFSRRMLAADLDRAIALAATGRVDLRSLITDRFGLEDTAAAFAAAASRRGLNVVIEPGRGGPADGPLPAGVLRAEPGG